MIDRLLQIHLEPIARAHRRCQLLRALSRGWLAAAGVGLSFIMVHRATGWISPWVLLLLFVATLTWTLGIWRRHQQSPLDFQTVAQNIEAQDPKLHALLLTAIEQRPDSPTQELNYLQDRVIREALAMDRRSRWRYRAAKQLRRAQLGNVAAAALLAIVWLTLYRAAPLRLAILTQPGHEVTVTPGDASIEKGSRLVVLAKFAGNVPAEAVLVVRPANELERRLPLTRNLDDPVFGASLPDVQGELTYYIEYRGERTRDFKVTTFEFPRLERADAKVTFPEYTGLPGKTIEDTRRVSAVEGSAVEYTFQLNKPVSSATFVEVRRGSGVASSPGVVVTPPSPRSDSPASPKATRASLPLLADTNHPNVYTFNCKLEQSARYELLLVDEAGHTNKVPPLFVFDALTNRAPELKFAFPKGDQRVSALEEMAFQAEVSDDFGLQAYGFAYNLAGHETKFVALGAAAGPNEKRTINQLVPLEALGAQVDELLSYYLWADDRGPDGQPRRTTSDMFFAEVRPFEEIFREGQPPDPNAQPSQSPGQGQNAAEKLAELQKQIITATWNLLRRETGKTPTAGFKADAQTVKDSQAQALEQVRDRMEQADDPRAKALLQTVQTQMAQAVAHLTGATDDNSPQALPPALAAEQSAYQALLRLAAREIQVSQGQRGQSGQSRRGQRAQRQLDQLNLRPAPNRYETERQAAPPPNPQSREQLQAFNRLQELAQRQQDVNERLKELQAALSEAKTAAEREELRQRLKRLQEDQQQTLADVDELRQRLERPENQSSLNEAREQLDQTRKEVQGAAEAMERGEVTQALASGTRAQRDLQQLRDDFRKQSSSQFADDLRELRRQARELAQKQEGIGQELDALADPTQRKTLTDVDGRKELAAQLDEQKKLMDELVKHATEVTQKAEPVEPLLSRQLYDTLRKATQDDARNLQATSDELLTQGRLRKGVEQYLRESRRGGKTAVEVSADLLREGLSAEADNLEQRARGSINELKTGVERAAESVLGDDTEALRMARNELDDLSRQLERELAEAQRSANTNGPGNRQGEAPDRVGGDEPPANVPNGREVPPPGEGQPGQRLARNQPQPGPGQQSNQPQPPAPSAPPGQPGPRTAANQGQGDGAGPTGNTRGPAGQNQAGQAGGEGPRGGQRGGGGGGGGGNFLDQFGGEQGGRAAGGPITGTEYTQWSDRLRDVEAMLDVPELRAEAARIRDRARNARQDLKRHAQEPRWDVVRMEIAGPLLELRSRISEELARRASKEALVPIDRDPVPTRYSELVRRYYEQLGKSESGPATEAGGVKP